MIRHALFWFIGIAVLAAAAATAVVAAACALYALLLPQVGAAAASAWVAAGATLLAAVTGFIFIIRSEGGVHRAPKHEPSLMVRVTEIARERPGLAIALSLAAGIVAIKNPKLVAGLASAFMAGKAADKAADKSRRRW